MPHQPVVRGLRTPPRPTTSFRASMTLLKLGLRKLFHLYLRMHLPVHLARVRVLYRLLEERHVLGVVGLRIPELAPRLCGTYLYHGVVPSLRAPDRVGRNRYYGV